MRVRATRVPDGEREAAWARIEAQWPGYRSYERESGRIVRLFVLQPVAEPRGAGSAAHGATGRPATGSEPPSTPVGGRV